MLNPEKHKTDMLLLQRRFHLILSLLMLPMLLMGQEEAVPVTLETPYNTIYSHLYYLQADSYSPADAARALYGVQDSTQRSRLAIKLKQIYDGKGLFVRINRIPQEAEYVDSTVAQAVFTPFPVELPEVYVERIDGLWYYSPETVSQIERLHSEVYPFGADLLLQLSSRFGVKEVLGMKAWQFIGLLLLLLLSIGLHFVLSRLLRPLVRRLSHSRLYPSLIPPKLIWGIARVLSVLFVLWFIKLFFPALQLPIEAGRFAVAVIQIVTIALVVVLLLRIFKLIMMYANKAAEQTESKMDEQLLPLVERMVQFLLFAGAIIQVLRLFEVDITTLIAGISIGGLAIALAAQDTIKNLFGSVTIFLDKPFQIGDWINFDGVDGMVEEVGFRSTRVRTFANSLVYVPNGRLSDMVVNNYGLRQYRRFNTNLSVTYDTPPELVEKFVEGLRELIAQHPQTRKDYYHIYFNNMGSHSLDILFYVFFEVASWPEELKARHELLLEVLKLGRALGIRFAFPTQTLHIEDFPGNPSNAPQYETDPAKLAHRLQQHLKERKN